MQLKLHKYSPDHAFRQNIYLKFIDILFSHDEKGKNPKGTKLRTEVSGKIIKKSKK